LVEEVEKIAPDDEQGFFERGRIAKVGSGKENTKKKKGKRRER